MRGESTQDITNTDRLASTMPKAMRSRRHKARTAHENESIANDSIMGMMTPFAVADEEILDIALPQPITQLTKRPKHISRPSEMPKRFFEFKLPKMHKDDPETLPPLMRTPEDPFYTT